MSHPEGDEEHLENTEDHIAREGKRHDAQERGHGAEYNGGANLSLGVSNVSILRDVRVLMSVSGVEQRQGKASESSSRRGVRNKSGDAFLR